MTKADFIREAPKWFKGNALQFILGQLQVDRRRSKGRRWTEDVKLLSLSLYYHSPHAYRFLSSIFHLPTVRSLQRFIQGVSVVPGIHESVLQALKAKVSLIPKEGRFVTLSFDEMSLKSTISYNCSQDKLIGFEDFGSFGNSSKIVTSALVFMVRGITVPFRQPIGYFLVHETAKPSLVSDIIRDSISKLALIGLTVKLIVCDQGFQHIHKCFDVTEQQPFFTFNEERVFWLFDPPHLIKSVRNMLEKYDIAFEGDKVASWTHILQLFQEDKERKYHIVPKLSHKHVHLTSFSRMKVKLTTQVLSHSVAVGLATSVALGGNSKLPSCATYTADFCEEMDILFDIFNSSMNVKGSRGKKLAVPISNNSNHISKLDQLHNFVSSWKFIDKSGKDVSSRIKCKHGWLLSIVALKFLWNDLQSKSVKFLQTRRLGQDTLEHFFSVIRMKGGFNDNPSPEMFMNVYKQSSMNGMLKPLANGNCTPEKVPDQILCQLFQCMSDHSSMTQDDRKEMTQTVMPFQTHDMMLLPMMDLIEENAFLYVSGYLKKSFLNLHKDCMTCQCNLSGNRDLDCDNKIFCYLKAYDNQVDAFHNLSVPSDEFLSFCHSAENCFLNVFKGLIPASGICNTLKNVILNECLFPAGLCEKGKHQLSHLFGHNRICFFAKFANRELMSVPRKNRKYVKVAHL